MTGPKDAPNTVPPRRVRKAAPPANSPVSNLDDAGAAVRARPVKAAPPDIFATAPDQIRKIKGLKMPQMRNGFQTVVHNLFESGFDVAKEFAEIVDSLEIKDALTPDCLRRAANKRESIANRAHQLYIIAKVEVAAYMRETEGIYGAIREEGIKALESEKAGGARTKQITDADAKAAAAALYPDEWADICTRRDRAEAMLKQLENLSQLARSRCYTVSAMSNPGSRTI